MKNTHSKKLLACFLAALGLSVNSLNASAKLHSVKFNQIINNTKFVLNLDEKKYNERNNLNKLADDIYKFLKENCDKETGLFIINLSESNVDYLKLCNRLYTELFNIYSSRDEKYENDYGFSILKSNLDKKQQMLGNRSVLQYYSDLVHNNEKVEFADVSRWLKFISMGINGGNCSVWGRKIQKAVYKLSKVSVI